MIFKNQRFERYGIQKCRLFFSQEINKVSTESEVLTAFLAIQHALKNKLQSLLIYTNNNKVEQLIKRP